MTKNRLNVSVMLALALTVLLTVTSCTKERRMGGIKGKPEQPTETTSPPVLSGREFILEPDAEGRLFVDNTAGTYKAGDVISLKGSFKSIVFVALNGASGSPIIVRNAPGTSLRVGDPSWNGGSWSTALSFRNSHFVKLEGSSKSDFIINGSTQSGRTAYFNLRVGERSDNFEISNISFVDGGTGIWAKTEPTQSDPGTFYPNSYLENLSIHDVTITGTYNEAMYIGHTANYWNLETGGSYSQLPAGASLGSTYVQPIKWRNVKIYNNVVKNGGTDGIQTAAIDGLEIYNNEVTNWGMLHNAYHCGGLLVGGRVTNSYVHDNYVHDGWGELLQFYGSGINGTKHIVKNNLFRDNYAYDGIALRGTENAVVTFSNNTVARVFGVCVRVSGQQGMLLPQELNANVLIQPRTGGGIDLQRRSYIYVENGANVTEGTGTSVNMLFASPSEAGVDVNNYYQPYAGSPIGSAGYRK